jgi:hypothetical protein
MRKLMLMAVWAVGAWGCDDDGDGGTAADGGATLDGGAADAGAGECAVDCGLGGTCVLEGGLPACQCGPGYERQGLSCVDTAEPPGVPDGFACPPPGDLSSAAATQLVTGGWAYRQNDRSCALGGGRDIFRFGDDGVLRRYQQFGDGATTGNLVYGCWALTSEVDGVLTLAWDHAEDNRWQLNCGMIGGLEDPPCGGTVAYDADRDGLVLQDQLVNGEVHVMYAVPETCTFCNDQPTCCDQPSWVEADGDALCE